MKAINLHKKFESIQQFWHPLQVALTDENQVVLIKMNDEVGGWFNHNEAKIIQVFKGQLEIHFRDNIELVKEGELFVVPQNTDFTPKAKGEVQLIVFESLETLND